MWFLEIILIFLSLLGAHAWLCRRSWSANSVMKFVSVAFPVGLCLLWRAVSLGSPEHRAGTFLYAFICELYIFLFGSIRSSLSVGLLMALKGEGKSREEAFKAYSSRALVSLRLKQLIREGLVQESEGNYRVTARGKRLTVFFRKTQDFFGHSKVPELAARASKL